MPNLGYSTIGSIVRSYLATLQPNVGKSGRAKESLDEIVARSTARTQETFLFDDIFHSLFFYPPKKAIEMGVLLSVSNRLLYDARGTDHHVIHIVIPA
jgi:hypothetical protein